MSYILEALRKAEKERNPVQPGITQSAPKPSLVDLSRFSAFRSYRPLLVAGLCFGLMLVLMISILQRHRETVPPVVAAPSAGPVTVTTATPANINLIQPLDQMIGNGPTTLDDIVENDNNNAETADNGSFSNAGNSFSASDDTPIAPANPTPRHTETAEVPEPAPSEPAEEMPVTTVEHVKLDAAPAPQVQKLSDMPADYRAAFPPLSFDVHSYDKSPKKRFIMIAGKRYNEGDALSEGPHIVQIVPEGVVFDFRGEQVLFTIAH